MYSTECDAVSIQAQRVINTIVSTIGAAESMRFSNGEAAKSKVLTLYKRKEDCLQANKESTAREHVPFQQGLYENFTFQEQRL